MRSLSQKHRLALILIQNNEGNTVLHYPYHPQKLKVLLDYIPNNRLLDILNLKNKHGQTPLDKVMLNTDHQEKMLELIIDYLPASIHPSPTNIASLRRLAQAVINYPDLLAHLKQQLHPRLFKEIFTFKLYYVDFLNRHRQFILQGGMAMAVTAVTAYIHFSNTQTEAFNEALIDPRSNLSPILNASSHTFFTTAKEMVLPLISNITGSSYGVS